MAARGYWIAINYLNARPPGGEGEPSATAIRRVPGIGKAGFFEFGDLASPFSELEDILTVLGNDLAVQSRFGMRFRFAPTLPSSS